MSEVSRSEIKQHERSSELSFSEKEVNAAVPIVNLLLLAWKNCSLYPEGHIAAIKVLEKLKTSFEAFFHTTTIFGFQLEKISFFGAPLSSMRFPQTTLPKIFFSSFTVTVFNGWNSARVCLETS